MEGRESDAADGVLREFWGVYPECEDVKVRYLPGGHFWTLESPKKTTEAVQLLLSMPL
jgi:hypothetical protein